MLQFCGELTLFTRGELFDPHFQPCNFFYFLSRASRTKNVVGIVGLILNFL